MAKFTMKQSEEIKEWYLPGPEYGYKVLISRDKLIDNGTTLGKSLIKNYPLEIKYKAYNISSEKELENIADALENSESINELDSKDIATALEKIIKTKSTASNIDSIVSTKNKLNNIHALLRDSVYKTNTDVTYIYSGDSTRDNTYNEANDHYNELLCKLNVSVYNNSSSGQSAEDWKNNTDQTTLQQAIDNSTGVDGENTILEYSLGLNDYDFVNAGADIKGFIKDGIVAYLAAKPKANVILVTPVKTNNTDRNTMLEEVYIEISNELNLPLISGYTATESVQGNSLYYQDGTHPNRWGTRRLLNYIFSEMLPFDLLGIMTLTEYLMPTPPNNNELNSAPWYESGYWSTSTGQPVGNADWRRIPEIAIEPNFTIRFIHQGNRKDVAWFDDQGVYIETAMATTVDTNTYEATAPVNAFACRINVTSDGTNYDLLGDQPSVKYAPISDTYLTLKEINEGLNIRNILSKFKDGSLIDDFGKIGLSGQTLTIDVDGKMKWI